MVVEKKTAAGDCCDDGINGTDFYVLYALHVVIPTMLTLLIQNTDQKVTDCPSSFVHPQLNLSNTTIIHLQLFALRICKKIDKFAFSALTLFVGHQR